MYFSNYSDSFNVSRTFKIFITFYNQYLKILHCIKNSVLLKCTSSLLLKDLMSNLPGGD